MTEDEKRAVMTEVDTYTWTDAQVHQELVEVYHEGTADTLKYIRHLSHDMVFETEAEAEAVNLLVRAAIEHFNKRLLSDYQLE